MDLSQDRKLALIKIQIRCDYLFDFDFDFRPINKIRFDAEYLISGYALTSFLIPNNRHMNVFHIPMVRMETTNELMQMKRQFISFVLETRHFELSILYDYTYCKYGDRHVSVYRKLSIFTYAL